LNGKKEEKYEEDINASMPGCSIYEYIQKNNKNYPADIDINYLGRKLC
jgi:long-chain acyl-CoA synthetase